MQFAWRTFIVFVAYFAGQKLVVLPKLEGRAQEVTEWAEVTAVELVKIISTFIHIPRFRSKRKRQPPT